MIWSTHHIDLNYESGLVEKDCLFTFINFHGQYLTHRCHKWKFEKILSYFELVMNFESFGQTTVDQSLALLRVFDSLSVFCVVTTNIRIPPTNVKSDFQNWIMPNITEILWDTNIFVTSKSFFVIVNGFYVYVLIIILPQ